MRHLLADARLGLRARRRRSLFAAVGIAVAAAMLAAALVVADGLGLGFDRAVHQSDLPDVIVRFNDENPGRVAATIRALPDLATFTLRREMTDVGLQGGSHHSAHASAEIVGPGRRGYAVVAGHDLTGRPGEVLLELGLARAWGVALGNQVVVAGAADERVVGFTRRVLPVLGDHDIRVAGEIPPSPRTQALATGGQALWEPPPHLSVPTGSQLTVGGSPDGPPSPQALDQLLDEALAGPRTPVPADPGRRELGVLETVARLGGSAGATTLDYAVPVADTVLVVVLDLARRGGGSGGLVRPGQPTCWPAFSPARGRAT